MLSTHYGPWGILAWATGLGACLGLTVGTVLLGIKPRKDAEPDSLHPLESRNLSKAVALAVGFSLLLLCSYPGYLVPRYQIGQDLREISFCQQQGESPGRTVVFLGLSG